MVTWPQLCGLVERQSIMVGQNITSRSCDRATWFNSWQPGRRGGEGERERQTDRRPPHTRDSI
jgi:hypothetical protein